MAHIIIDRRLNGGNKSSQNRQKFLERHRKQIKKQVKDMINDGSIEDLISNDSKRKINIPVKDTHEPHIYHDMKSGRRERILPGNKKFNVGDREPKPAGGEGEGNEASADGEGEDNFGFEISQEEFLNYLFEDLELPDLVKKEMAQIFNVETKRSGFTNAGNPCNLDLKKTMMGAKQRNFALVLPKKRKIKKLEEELKLLEQENPNDSKIELIKDEILKLKRQISAVPYIDELDLKYKHYKQFPVPATKAVMFAIMDVSGSMEQEDKNLAKRFFILLFLFLKRNYKDIEVVFIRHHTSAKEVDEEEFFGSRETGGTLVSPALDLTSKIIEERYNPNEWNTYVCQASDGDNWSDDNDRVRPIINNKLMSKLRHFFYVEIKRDARRGSDLWNLYQEFADQYDNFSNTVVTNRADIYPVFRELFEKE